MKNLFTGTKKIEISTFTLPLTMLVISIVISSLYLFRSYTPETHDILSYLSRIKGMAEVFSEGASKWPVVILPNQANGFGCAGILYPHLIFIIPSICYMKGMSLVQSYQVMIWLVQIISAVCMYISVKLFDISSKNALWATALFMLMPYRVGDLWWRGAVCEALAMAFIPIIIAGIYRIACVKSKNDWIWLFIGVSGIFQSHILTFVIAIVTSVICFLTLFKMCIQKEALIGFAKAVVATIIFNFWYIVPFLKFYLLESNVDQLKCLMSESAATFADMIIVKDFHRWPNAVGIIVFLVIALIVAMNIYLCIYSKKSLADQIEILKENALDKYTIMMLVLGITGLFLGSVLFPWKMLEEAIPAINIFQFPNRFFVLPCTTLPIVFAVVFTNFQNMENHKAVNGFILAIVMVTASISAISEYNAKPDNNFDYELDDVDFDYRIEYLPKGATSADFTDQNAWASSNITILSTSRDALTTAASFTASSGSDLYIDMPLMFYPGYQAYLFDESGSLLCQLSTCQGDGYRVRANIPSSIFSANDFSGLLAVTYAGIWYFKIASIVSVCGTILLVIYIIFGQKKF